MGRPGCPGPQWYVIEPPRSVRDDGMLVSPGQLRLLLANAGPSGAAQGTHGRRSLTRRQQRDSGPPLAVLARRQGALQVPR